MTSFEKVFYNLEKVKGVIISLSEDIFKSFTMNFKIGVLENGQSEIIAGNSLVNILKNSKFNFSIAL